MSTLFYVSYLALWLLLLGTGVLVLLLYRHFGVVALGTLEGVQRDGLPVGEVAPAVDGMTAAGVTTTWAPQPGQLSLLLFVAPDCAPCATVLPAASRLAGAADNRRLAVTAVVPGPPEGAAALAERFRLPFLCLAEAGRGVFDRYRVRVTPFAFVIGEDGRILAKGLCSDAGRLRDLLLAGGIEATVPEPTILLAENGRGPAAATEATKAKRGPS